MLSVNLRSAYAALPRRAAPHDRASGRRYGRVAPVSSLGGAGVWLDTAHQSPHETVELILSRARTHARLDIAHSSR